jgi:hypothetical protein
MIPQDETQERQRLIEKAYAEAKIAEARIKAGERITAEDLMATVLPVVTPPLQDETRVSPPAERNATAMHYEDYDGDLACGDDDAPDRTMELGLVTCVDCLRALAAIAVTAPVVERSAVSCRGCDQGLVVMMLDEDGCRTDISQKIGVPSHAADDAFWPCEKWTPTQPKAPEGESPVVARQAEELKP